jgi:hypothetical protein
VPSAEVTQDRAGLVTRGQVVGSILVRVADYIPDQVADSILDQVADSILDQVAGSILVREAASIQGRAAESIRGRQIPMIRGRTKVRGAHVLPELKDHSGQSKTALNEKPRLPELVISGKSRPLGISLDDAGRKYSRTERFFCSFYYILLQHDGGLESLFLKAGMIIPNEIIDWFRSVFADANRRLAEKMLNVPSIPEPHLDTTFVEHLMSFATPRKFKGDWAIRIDTHYIGGLAQYWSWEIADIGVFVFFQRKGQLVRQKVALLQSKRLYPIVGDVVELEDFDYMIGMARLGARQGPQAAIIADRIFRFTMSSGYQALQPGSEQTKHIGEFIKRREIPVFYLFYNPPRTPLRVVVPVTRYIKVRSDPMLGSRVVPAPQILKLLDKIKKIPTLQELDDFLNPTEPTLHTGGWRLEYFMTDLLIGCSEGKRFSRLDEEDLIEIFERRSGPITATVAVTVEMPDDAELPD